MPFDTSIPLQVQQPNPTNLISSWADLGIKRNLLQRSNETLLSDIARAKAESSLAQTQASVAQQTAGPTISQAQSQAGTAAAQMSDAQLTNMRNHVANATQQLEILRQKPDLTREDITQSIYDSLRNQNAPPEAAIQALQGIPPKGQPPEVYKQFVTQSLVKAQALATHLDKIAPAPIFIGTGQTMNPVASGNQAVTGIPAGTPQGVPTQMEVPPGTPTMVGNQPSYVGARPNQAGPIPSGPALGQAAGVEGPIQAATEHYKQVVAEAQPAQTRIAALQTIKQEAPQAVTGGGTVGEIKRKIMTALANVYGMPTDATTSTDVMAKNLALVAGQAGNTDAARALGEMSNPNYHMTKEAIQQTGNQLLGIEYKKIAAQQVFSGIPTDSKEYSQKWAVWNKNADPRIWEYENLSPSERKEWKQKNAAIFPALMDKARALSAIGAAP